MSAILSTATAQSIVPVSTGLAVRAPDGRHPRRATTASRRQPLDERLPLMARAFAHLFLEVEAGLRPRRQVQRIMSPLLYARLSDVWLRPAPAPAKLCSVSGVRSAPARYDAVATVDRGHRITALAFRIGRGPAGWLVSDLIRPEEGPLPDPPYPVPNGEPDLFDLVLG